MSRQLLLRSTLAIVLLCYALQGAADGGVGRYRVTINLFPGEDAGLVARQLAATYRGQLEPYGEEGFTGFMIVTTDATAQLLSRDRRVVLVEPVRPDLTPDDAAGASSPPPAPRQVRTDATGSSWSIGPYAYDGSGNISAIGRGDTTSDKFVYDAFGRLRSGMVGTNTRKQEYTYDAFGNMLTITTDGDTANKTKLGVDPTTNRITRSSDPSTGEVFNAYGGYDGAGNMEWNSAGDTFSYDSLGMLRESTVAGVRKVYLYTPDDERIASVTVVNGAKQSAEWTLRDPGGMGLRRYYESASGTWTWSEDYIYQGTQLLAAEVNAPEKTLHFFPDHLGTPRLITGSGGAEFSRRSYYPFGRQASASPGDYEKKGFTGHERDDPSLDYMHARSYLSLWGRFLSVDPVPGRDAEPQSWNRYAYVRNSPMNFVDPTGMADCAAGTEGVSCFTFTYDSARWPTSRASDSSDTSHWVLFGEVAILLTEPTAIRNPITGMTVGEHWRASGHGVAAFTDGLIPFIDPLANVYGDGTVDGLQYSEGAGEITQAVALSATGGQGIKFFELGKNSRLFAKGSGLLNKNDYVRVGWSWRGTRKAGAPVFRMAIGGRNFRVPLPARLRHIDFF